LLYYPISDEYAVRGKSMLLHFDGAAKGSSVRKSAEFLFAKGYAFDYISDRQMAQLETKSGQILTGGNSWQTVLLPPVKLMPVETFENILNLARNGATVLLEELPTDVPGLGNLPERQLKLKNLVASMKFSGNSTLVKTAKVGKGRVMVGNLSDLLAEAKIRRETMSDRGIQFVRRKVGTSQVYFIANRGSEHVDGLVPIESAIGSAVLYNPMNGDFGLAMTKVSGKTNMVYLQLKPGAGFS
jgi:hypothetical protein